MPDLMGLGSPGVLEAMRGGKIGEFVLAREPAFPVSNIHVRDLLGPLLGDPRFVSPWRVVGTIPPDSRHLTSLRIHQRTPAHSP